MLVLDRGKPISVQEAVDLRNKIGPFGIAPYIGGPCAADVWPADLCLQLLAANFPMAGYWVGSNTGCWVAEYDDATGRAHAERAMQDAHIRDLDKAPIILDVEYDTWHMPDGSERPGVRGYIVAFLQQINALGGAGWLYGSGDMIRAIDATTDAVRGCVLAAWNESGDYRPIPADPPRGAGHQYAHDVTDLLGDGAVDCSVINEADLYSHGGSTDMFDATPVKALITPDGGGAWILTATGAIYTSGNAPYLGAINPGNGDNITRVGTVRDLHPNPKGYTIETFDGEMVRFYDFPGNWAVQNGHAAEAAPATPATAG